MALELFFKTQIFQNWHIDDSICLTEHAHIECKELLEKTNE